jgi:hypothetical protein
VKNGHHYTCLCEECRAERNDPFGRYDGSKTLSIGYSTVANLLVHTERMQRAGNRLLVKLTVGRPAGTARKEWEEACRGYDNFVKGLQA